MASLTPVNHTAELPAWASMDDITDSQSGSGSNVKFITKRSISKLREEKSRTKLYSPTSSGDLEAAIKEELKSDTAVMELSAEGSGSDLSESPERKPVTWEAPIPKLQLIVILASLSVGLFLSLMDTVVLSAALVTISEEFGDWRLTFWAVMSYSLAYTAGGALFARLGDVCGRQTPVIGSFVAFGVFSIACGFAQNLHQLIAFRALQGLGGSGLYTMTMIVYPEIAPPGLLPFISTLMGMTISAAGVAGPLIGGAFARNNWRWIFWMNAPICAIPAVVLPFVWPQNRQWAKLGRIRVRQLDFFGLILITAGSVLLAVGLQQAGNRTFAWDSSTALALFILGGLSWFTLILWSKYISRPRLGMIAAQFPWRLMTDRVVMATIGSTLATGFVYIGCLINIPIRTQVVNMKGSVAAGLHLLPLMGLCAFGSAFGGAIQSKKNLCSYTLVVASMFVVGGAALLSTLDRSIQIQPRQWAGECLVGLGVGMTLSTVTILTSLKVQMRDHGIGQALVAQSRTLGGVFGIATSTILFNRQIDQDIHPDITQEELYALYSSPTILGKLNPSQQQWISGIYAAAFNDTLRAYMCLAIAAFVFSLLTWQRNPMTMAEKKEQLEKALRSGEVIHR